MVERIENITQAIDRMLHRPWSFARYGDWEIGAMVGLGIESCDGQRWSPEVAASLWRTFDPPGAYTYGIQGLALRQGIVPARLRTLVDWMDADMFHRASRDGLLHPLVQFLRTRKVGLVGPKRLCSLLFLTSGGHVEAPERDCFYERAHLTPMVEDMARGCDVLVLCCGVLAKVMVHHLHPRFGDRTSILDLGSLWDVYAGFPSRSYQRAMDDDTLRRSLEGPSDAP